MIRNKPVESFPRSSNGRTAAFGAVNRGSNPCRGAKLPRRVLTQRSRFLFYNFRGSNAAEFRTVRTGLGAERRPAKQLYQSPPEVDGAAPRPVAAKIVRMPDSLTAACRWPDRWAPALHAGSPGSFVGALAARLAT